jgi:hypothetical protein
MNLETGAFDQDLAAAAHSDVGEGEHRRQDYRGPAGEKVPRHVFTASGKSRPDLFALSTAGVADAKPARLRLRI